MLVQLIFNYEAQLLLHDITAGLPECLDFLFDTKTGLL